MNLLEKAQSVEMKSKNARTHIADEHIELALAWVEEKVTITQINEALETTSTASYSILARALKKHLTNQP